MTSSTSTTGNPEAALLARLRTGDGAAYETLFRTNGGAMRAIACRFFGDTADAADAIQDASLSAFRAIPRFEGTARLGTWLHQITVNACLLKLRTRKRSRLVPLDEGAISGAEAGRLTHFCSTDVPSDDGLTRAETAARIRACIDRLPHAYRTVIQLRDLEEFDTDAVAARLGTNSGVVKTRLHRARHALRALLEPASGSGGIPGDRGV